MADEPLPPLRVVLDTNVLVSALQFRQGRLGWIRSGWKNPPAGRKLTPPLGPVRTWELIRLLASPKFQLTQGKVSLLLTEILPFAETVPVDPPILSGLLQLRDAAYQNVVELAIGSAADVLVSVDADLLVLAGELGGLPILSPGEFEDWWKAQPQQSSPAWALHEGMTPKQSEPELASDRGSPNRRGDHLTNRRIRSRQASWMASSALLGVEGGHERRYKNPKRLRRYPQQPTARVEGLRD